MVEFAFHHLDIQKVLLRTIRGLLLHISEGPNRLVEADSQAVHTKRTLRPPGLNQLARGVVVIAVGNEHGDTSSNPGRD